MDKKQNNMSRTTSANGVLHPTISQTHYLLEHYPPNKELKPFIEKFWHVNWNLINQAPHTQQNLPHPNPHITFEQGKAIFYGPVKKRFTRTLSGKGNIFGIKFNAGGVVPFIQTPMSTMTDTQIELSALLNESNEGSTPNINDENCIKSKIQLAENFLQTLLLNNKTPADINQLKKHTDKIQRVNKLIKLIENTHSITKVEQLSEVTNLSDRSLQRLFKTYVGVSPKWLIRKFRIHEILTRLELTTSIDGIDWQQIVVDLKYVDQAHLINDFKYFIGYTPNEYVRRNRKTTDHQ